MIENTTFICDSGSIQKQEQLYSNLYKYIELMRNHALHGYTLFLYTTLSFNPSTTTNKGIVSDAHHSGSSRG